MSATNSEPQNLEIDQLQGQLRREIGGRKYLLVLDDVWSEKPEEWLNLSAILKVGGVGSMILVTTRSRKVADIMGSLPPYDLKGLSKEKSWALFEKMAFEPGESQSKPHLAELGEEIVKKCGAVPLALRALGTLLRGNVEWKWISVAGASFADLPDEQNKIMAILKLSYYHLPSPLKNCFAYCALFPKDYEYEKEMLVDLWMAEGFVNPSNETQSLKELGDEYLILLLQRCFFQDVARDEYGDISSFKMHDLMHDLALEVAGSESKVAKFQDDDFSDRIRHLSFNYHLACWWEIPSSMLKAKQLRTFLLPGQLRDDSDFKKAILKQLTSSFKCLRVLDLRNLGIKTLPKSIGKLIHLRSLNLSMNPIEELPHSITELQNLQTVNLYHCTWLKVLPADIKKLTNLTSLNVSECYGLTYMPSGLGELTSLHKLPLFIVENSVYSEFIDDPPVAQLRDLNKLNNLRGSLDIKLYDDVEEPVSQAKEANLNLKHGLRKLLVQFNYKPTSVVHEIMHDEAVLEGLKPHRNLKKLEIYWYRGQKLPSWAMTDTLCTTLPNLVEIRVCHCKILAQLPSFSHLPFLRRLSLVCLVSVEYMERRPCDLPSSSPSSSRETFFPSLQELDLMGMSNLKGWWEEKQAKRWWESQCDRLSLSFCALARLRIQDCEKLASFPLCPNVKELVLNKVNKNLTVLTKLTSVVRSDVGSSVTIPENGSKLEALSVNLVEDFIHLPEEILGHLTSLEIKDSRLLNTSGLEGVFKHLSSLRCLKFTSCHSLTSISEGLEHLVSLDSLVLQRCGALNLSENRQLQDGMPWKALNRIRSLQLDGLSELEHLPSELRYLTKLRALMVFHNINLVELPEWISCFSSLEFFELFDCPRLTCLPEEIGKLNMLTELKIVDCHELTERCRGPNGSDWQKIQYIPLLTVRETVRGCY